MKTIKTIKIKKGILIAFGEIFLKSEGVRNLFQKKLERNLVFFLKKEKIDFKIHYSRDRIFIETDEIKKVVEIIKNIFGIVWFAESFYFVSEKTFNKTYHKINLNELSKFIDDNYEEWIKKNETFAIRLKLEKNILKENRDKVIKIIAQNIDRKVNLSKPKKEMFIEIRRNGWFIYFKKQKGAGGLPAGSGGKVLSLISGGIDSPVSSYLSAKRGAENMWLHFHSFPLVSKKSIDKIEECVNIFLRYQIGLKIYFVPFSEAQIKIKAIAPAKYRVLLYRRLMLKTAEKIAEKENCSALITGESLGQVSSQTLANLKITEEIVKIPVLRPLIAMDKEEIIKLAKEIDVFEISIKPQEDCCTLFVSKGQTAKGNIEIVKELEKKIGINKMILEIMKKVEIKRY
ncbi:MAG: tRNA uracil 4-sulfurtransferase ThiI [Candidatus Nealsonbacteria bacterium]